MTRSTEKAKCIPSPITFRQAFGYWLKLGFISFGGPAGQIAVMHHDLVENKRWLSERRFLHALNYCMLLPGPEAQQLATYIGWLLHGVRGGIVAGSLFVLPSWILLLGLSWIYLSYGQVPAVAGILYGIKPAVTAIVVFAAYRIGSRVLHHALLWTIAGAAFAAIFYWRTPFPLIVFSAAALGAIGAKWCPRAFTRGSGHADAGKSYGPALIDNDTPPSEHVRFNAWRLSKILLIGLALWCGLLALLWTRWGWHGALTQMAWFFTKAALLTFGGAYAVLPYVYQGAVEQFGWLEPEQMIDGLALGETTPGPLIMVVAFVGYVAGWSEAILGPEQRILAGALASAVVTFVTFLPSFLFILVGAPLIESTHGNIRFIAPLTGVTAAIVGVILNLAIFFAMRVYWPQGFAGRLDPVAFLISIAALWALLKGKSGVIPVIIGCGVAGFVYKTGL